METTHTQNTDLRAENIIAFPGRGARLHPHAVFASQAVVENDLLCMANYLARLAPATHCADWVDALAVELRHLARAADLAI